jgi:hypothetical protein
MNEGSMFIFLESAHFLILFFEKRKSSKFECLMTLCIIREGMALGLMFMFVVVLVKNVTKLSVGDSVESFEERIDQLDHLEKNGFSVPSLRSYLIKLFETKSAYMECLRERGPESTDTEEDDILVPNWYIA